MKKPLLLLSLSLSMLFAWSQDEGEPGTKEKPTQQEIQRNTVSVDYRFVFLSALYERTFPLGKKTGLIGGAGIAQGVAGTGATNPIVKASFLFGRPRHFLDAGIIVAPWEMTSACLTPWPVTGTRARKDFSWG